MAQLGENRVGGVHLTEEDFVWFYYGEAENAAEIDLHLAVCNACRSAYESYKREMKLIEALPIPERGPEYGDQVWRSLVKRDAAIARPLPWWKKWTAPRKIALAGAVCTMLAVAFFAGRVTHQAEAPEVALSSEAVRERLLAVALGDHLEQSERTLVELTNSESLHKVDIEQEQRRAESLLSANRLYRLTAERDGQEALANVLDDLERVLLDVAHAPKELSREQLDRIRARVEDQNLLFKVRVLERRLRELNNQPARQEPSAQEPTRQLRG